MLPAKCDCQLILLGSCKLEKNSSGKIPQIEGGAHGSRLTRFVFELPAGNFHLQARAPGIAFGNRNRFLTFIRETKIRRHRFGVRWSAHIRDQLLETETRGMRNRQEREPDGDCNLHECIMKPVFPSAQGQRR